MDREQCRDSPKWYVFGREEVPRVRKGYKKVRETSKVNCDE